jgi:hypothetical protein
VILEIFSGKPNLGQKPDERSAGVLGEVNWNP